VTFALARSLILADAVTPNALARALLESATSGTSLVRALLATRAIDAMRLEQLLERGEAPAMKHVVPVMSLVQRLPAGLCERLLAVPVRRDVRTGTIDVAVVDASDTHPVEEIAYWLKAPVRTVRTSLASMDEALRDIQGASDPGLRSLAAPMGQRPLREEPDIAIPLVRRSSEAVEIVETVETVTIVEIGPPAIERDVRPEAEPVLDLRRRKSMAPAPTEPRAPAKTTLMGPYAPNAPAQPFADVFPIVAEMRQAADRDQILELVVTGVRTVARRVAVLAVRREGLVGWTCSSDFADRTAFRSARVPMTARTVFHDAIEREGASLARLPKDGTHAPLIAVMRTPPAAEVAFVAVRVEGKPVALVLADEIGDTLVTTKRMEELATVAGESLARLLRERRGRIE
jgi:hypothetical protein